MSSRLESLDKSVYCCEICAVHSGHDMHPRAPYIHTHKLTKHQTHILHTQVYLALEELGWRPAVRTWCDKTLHGSLPMLAPQFRAYIYSLFDAHVDAGLAWLAANK